jgi:hypothetical protein
MVIHLFIFGVSKSSKATAFGTQGLYMQFDGTNPLLTSMHIC